MFITAADGIQKWIIAAILCCGITISGIGVSGAPLEIEKNETPFPLELQPPLIDNLQDAVDSYGNPIKFSQPIETPDGRKVITAQGVQFEIPNYASGITEIKKPIDNLLPPFIDPIAVALANDADANIADDSSPQEYTLPDWLADLNDPDIGPGVPYTPSEDDNSLKILSWDLIPPQQQDPETSTSHSAIGQQKNFHVTLSPGQSFAFNRNVQPTTSRTTTTSTTTTPKPTTTTTTTRRTTTTTTTTTPPPPTTTTSAPFRASSSNSAEIYALPGGNSLTLPSWLEGIDDPELSVAVPFEVPEDNNEYNHTLSNDLLPPLEPFQDLKVLSVPQRAQSPAQAQPIAPISITTTPRTTTTTIRTTTTARPSPSTPTPFQFKFFTTQTVTPPSTTTQKTSFFTAPTATTTTENPIANRITQFTLKSVAAQPTGFKSNAFPASQPTAAAPVRPTVPPRPVLDVKNNPFFSSRGGFTTNPTTTTTTQAPITTSTEQFRFDSATIPSWLSDIQDPELGPGVPFTLAGSSNPQLVYNDLQPPSSQIEEQTIDGVTIQKSISSELPPLSFLHNSILSQSVPTIQPFTATTVQEPSRLFTPPVVVVPDDDDTANTQSQTNSYSNNNFPAATEPTTKTTSKVTFEKSDQGKVISNSVFAPQTTKPNFGLAQPSGFTSATASPGVFTKPTTTAAVFTGKYTGGFGGAPGFLGGQNKPGYAIQPDGSIRDPDHTVRPVLKVAQPTVPVPVAVPVPIVQQRIDVPVVAALPKPTVATGPKRGYTGSFGGPPGILVPFDNVKSA